MSLLRKVLHTEVPLADYSVVRAKAERVVDVRSPSEFEAAHIPGSVNVPLFSDVERAIVGTLYKNAGKDASIIKGLEIVEPKLNNLLAALKFEADKYGRIGVVCARGGMRSRAIVNFMRNHGLNAFQITGGFKAYRQWTLDALSKVSFPAGLWVLHGLTGTGKTAILNKLPNSIDLEKLASHKSSVFGGIGKSKVTQKNFEGLLADEIFQLDFSRPVFIEGESRKIGDLSIPDSLFKAMSEGRKILLEAAMPVRVENIIRDYSEALKMNTGEFESTILDLKGLLGKEETMNLASNLKSGSTQWVVERLLRLHYDNRYGHSYREYQFDLRMRSDDPEKARSQILESAELIGLSA